MLDRPAVAFAPLCPDDPGRVVSGEEQVGLDDRREADENGGLPGLLRGHRRRRRARRGDVGRVPAAGDRGPEAAGGEPGGEHPPVDGEGDGLEFEWSSESGRLERVERLDGLAREDIPDNRAPVV